LSPSRSQRNIRKIQGHGRANRRKGEGRRRKGEGREKGARNGVTAITHSGGVYKGKDCVSNGAAYEEPVTSRMADKRSPLVFLRALTACARVAWVWDIT
tara:strand:+ start:62 stop:358 length:297 start_codon:yes stop_codon:yes gene_type:complete